MNIAIEVNNLTKYYSELLAVDPIDFEMHQGEVFGFLGPNGAGKTTTTCRDADCGKSYRWPYR